MNFEFSDFYVGSRARTLILARNANFILKNKTLYSLQIRMFFVILQTPFSAVQRCGTATADMNAASSGSGIGSCAVAVAVLHAAFMQGSTQYTRSGPCTRETNESTIFAHQVTNKCAVNVPVLRSSVSVFRSCNQGQNKTAPQIQHLNNKAMIFLSTSENLLTLTSSIGTSS